MGPARITKLLYSVNVLPAFTYPAQMVIPSRCIQSNLLRIHALGGEYVVFNYAPYSLTPLFRRVPACHPFGLTSFSRVQDLYGVEPRLPANTESIMRERILPAPCWYMKRGSWTHGHWFSNGIIVSPFSYKDTLHTHTQTAQSLVPTTRAWARCRYDLLASQFVRILGRRFELLSPAPKARTIDL